ncbi:MAG: ParA family protein [Gammaproteobacteria bacterium]|nr:ParA family protein [Gammaproteobacteria bacterium]MDH3371410.1 ParA family protein [Gammaproteobacteria bacterium]MDH3406383.1 ParA family protein [Gammaproteobacteria bacterium]MDH3562286.1 ParA family protein [Gammaproteobacteria bacterium]MDH5487426.1 ParA family protein [Gammaproteobacteria bacterium]
MGKVVAITNQKGGVGKTTTSINLAASLARTRRRVMLIDNDPQGNATMGSGVNKQANRVTTYEVLIGLEPIEAARVTVEGGFDLVPSNSQLSGAEIELIELEHRERRLRDALENVRTQYDYILIDCPPALNLLTVNALVAAQSVMIPMQCEYYALEGLTALLNTIRKIRETLNPELEIEGLLRTMYDPRNNLDNEVSAQLKQHFGDKLYRTVIPRNIRLAEAPSHGKPVIAYDMQSKGAQAYLALAGEMLRREEEVVAA